MNAVPGMKSMLFSVSYAGFWGQQALSMLDFIDRAAGLGYQAVELMAKRPHLSIVDCSDEDCRQLRRRADEVGVEIATLAGYTDFTSGYAHREVPHVEFQLAYVRRLAEMAQILGAKIIRVFTGYRCENAAWFEQRELCIRALRECGSIAADHGVVIGVQNHHDIAVGVDDYASFMAEVGHDSVRAMFDLWSIAAQDNIDVRAAARTMAAQMVQTTTADYRRLPQYRYQEQLINFTRDVDARRAVPMGRGCLDYESFFAGLREGGFNGYVSYEMCSPVLGGGSQENLDATAAESLEYLHKLMAP